MDKQTFIYMLIEAVIFIIPIATLFIKLGRSQKVLEDVDERTKNYPEWKAATETKVNHLEMQTIAQQHVLDEISKNIYQISTKMDLLLEDKLKIRG